jgi:hypothetical protein
MFSAVLFQHMAGQSAYGRTVSIWQESQHMAGQSAQGTHLKARSLPSARDKSLVQGT